MASASEIELSQAHEQLRHNTVKHRVGKLEGVGEDEAVDIGGVKDIAIDFLAGVVSGISGIVVGQVGVCFMFQEINQTKTDSRFLLQSTRPQQDVDICCGHISADVFYSSTPCSLCTWGASSSALAALLSPSSPAAAAGTIN